jgi:hypothetical protein
MLAAASLAVLAPPVVADVPGTPVTSTAGEASATLLPDERDAPLRPLALIAPAALIVALSTLGLTITIRSLRDDLKQRRNVYRRRGGGETA